jgi:hypothetical protein
MVDKTLPSILGKFHLQRQRRAEYAVFRNAREHGLLLGGQGRHGFREFRLRRYVPLAQ